MTAQSTPRTAAGGSAVDRAATGLAVFTSRRGFLEKTLKGAAGVAMSLAFVGADATPAYAATCGPSPYCPSGSCNNARKRCNSTNTAGKACRNTNYGHTVCPRDYAGCWSVNSGSTIKLCCDCCCKNATGNACGSCGSGYRKCICLFTCC